MPSRTPLRRCARMLLLVSAALGVACSGGSTSTPPAAPAIGTAGGTVTEASGASVVVPPGALGADVAIQIARDSTGAPPLPTGLVTAGATYVITPHGGDFARPVEVRIPAPGVTLLPTQELKLATAEPGAEWVVLGDSEFTAGVLSAKVGSFSFFVPVVVTYPASLLVVPPLRVSSQLDCGGMACDLAVGPVAATFTVTANNGQLPANCVDGRLKVHDGLGPTFTGGTGSVPIPLTGTIRTRTVQPQANPYYFVVGLMCGNNGTRLGFGAVSWFVMHYPLLAVRNPPAQLDLVEGLGADLEVTLAGGAYEVPTAGQAFHLPTPSDRATVDWQRSEDGGGSWRTVARSYQDEANPDPLGSGLSWRHWSVHHGFIASAGDQGALIRVQACYTPLDVAAPPCVTSSATRLNVLQFGAPPAITTQPASLSVVAGSDAAFAVAATGTGPLAYQWRLDGAPIAGATGPVLRLSAVTAGSAGGYGVVVSNAAGSAASDTAILTVSTGAPPPVAPTIVTQPAPVLVHAGDTATFAVGVGGSGPLSFAWRKDGAPIAGATSAALTLVGVAAGDAGSYSVVVGNAAGSATSLDAALSVAVTPPPALTAPSISTQPATLVVVPGDAATLAVAASGSGPLGYQWSLDGAPVAGATGPVLTLPSVGATEAGSYTVTIANDAGSVTSNPAQLILVGAPSITVQPPDATVAEGSTATFTVAATGAALRYQWARDGLTIPGATGPSHTTPATALADSGAVYSVLVYNGAGLVASRPAVLTVTAVVPTSRAWVPAALIETDSVGDGTRAKVAMDATGNAIAVWQQNDNVRPNIWANRYSATTQSWGVPTLLETDNAGGAFQPQVAMAGNGDAVAVWYQEDGLRSNIWTNRYVAATDSWGTATLLETSTATAGSPQVAVDGAGNAMVVWDHYAGSASIWAIRYTVGTGWDAAAQRIETATTNSAGGAEIAVGANGDAFAVWTSFDGARNNTWANRYAIATHAWETATLIESGNAGTTGAAHVAVDANGNAVAAWSYFDGARYDILVNRYSVSGNSWEPVTQSLVATATGSGDAPRVALDVAGNATVVWAQADAGRYSIWANRLTVGAGWGTANVIETDDAGDAALPQVAVDSIGNAIAVWYQSDGTRNNIVSNRFTAGAGWGTAAVLETGDGTALRPHVAVNASGIATAVWDQHDGSRISIWASGFR